MNNHELEAVVLSTCLDIIEDLLSNEIVTYYKDINGIITETKPRDYLQKRLFSIIILELTTGIDNSIIGRSNISPIEYLKFIGQEPLLGNRTKGKKILSRAISFDKWLKKEFNYRIYSSMGKHVRFNMSREDMLYYCGNRKKHSILGLGRAAKKLKAIYENRGILVSGNEYINILNDIENWLYDDVFSYHFTKICELLNNIYNAIIEYSIPIYKKSFIKLDNLKYKYDIPTEIQDNLARDHYYNLLNRIWHKKNLSIINIKTDKWLTLRY